MGRNRNNNTIQFIAPPPIKAGGAQKNKIAYGYKNCRECNPNHTRFSWDMGFGFPKNADGEAYRMFGFKLGKYNYTGHFRQWEIYRYANGLVPYLGLIDAEFEKGDDRLLAYLAMSVGPLNKDMPTTITHLRGIGHFRKLQLGPNPIINMPRV